MAHTHIRYVVVHTFTKGLYFRYECASKFVHHAALQHAHVYTSQMHARTHIHMYTHEGTHDSKPRA